MGRLTEVFDVIKNGFDDPENYHWIDVENEKTRDVLKAMRRLGLVKRTVEPTLFE